MTIATAYWCILITALLPYVLAAVAKTSAPGYNNRNPRAWLAKQGDNYRLQRANAAHLNAFEAFAPFAAGVLMAQAAGVDHGRIALLALLFVAMRIAHGVFYVVDLQLARSVSWLGGFACVAALMVQAAMAAAG
jgi:uncharacterized MAPEG superfamily protein